MGVKQHKLLADMFDDHAADIYRYLARRVGESSAEELLSGTFMAAVEHIDTYNPDLGSPRAWLFGIASNQIRRAARAESRQLAAYSRTTLEVAHVDDDAESIAQRMDAKKQVIEVAESIAAMPDDARDVLLLFAWADLSYTEIATALDIPIGTVRSRLSRARQQLRSILAPTPTGIAL